MIIARLLILVSILLTQQLWAAPTLSGAIVDAGTGEPTPARLYVKGEKGTWHHVRSRGGVAIPYKVQRGKSLEVHTTLSGHQFEADLPPGKYTLIAKRGKEYHPTVKEIEIGEKVVVVKLVLKRWTSTTLASRGWYSGDTHVHRPVDELPTLMLAEDLNVGLPLTSWVTDSRESPRTANKNPKPVPPAKLIKVDDTHVIWPISTEYEIFTIEGKRHTLGAVFALNHQRSFELKAPPVRPIAEEARRQGAILDLDKQNWPWSMMLIPIMGVDLFELTNNHLWRTDFLFANWYPEYVPKHFGIELKNGSFSERDWIDFGFKNYYALLNCGFRMKPSGGTASGVHPVPLGFGRVYVKIDGEFSYEKWMKGLEAGRSFVTTGPTLEAIVVRGEGNRVTVNVSYEGRSPDAELSVIVNGKKGVSLDGKSWRTKRGSHRTTMSGQVDLESTSWIAVRAFEDRPDGRPRFAHTAPVWIDLPGKPLVPDKADVDYLVKRVEDELKRHEGVLPEEALKEYREAAKVFRSKLP